MKTEPNEINELDEEKQPCTCLIEDGTLCENCKESAREWNRENDDYLRSDK